MSFSHRKVKYTEDISDGTEKYKKYFIKFYLKHGKVLPFKGELTEYPDQFDMLPNWYIVLKRDGHLPFTDRNCSEPKN